MRAGADPMVVPVGFPVVTHGGIKPGQGFAAQLKGAVVFCVQGQFYPFVLIGHGEAPRRMDEAMDGPLALLPGQVQLRPIREKPWNMDWRGHARPGDLVLCNGTAIMKMQPHKSANPHAPGDDLVDLRTGSRPPGSISGPVFRGWQLICLPMPNRPMVLGTYDPSDPTTASQRTAQG